MTLLRTILFASLTLTLNLTLTPIAHAEFGKGYELSGPLDKPLFLFSKSSTVAEGLTTERSSYTDLAGKELVSEEAVFAKVGEKLQAKTYKISQKQLGADGRVAVKDGKINFAYTVDGKTKDSSETLKGIFLVGPGIVPFIQENWSDLMAGKKIEVRFAVPDRRETVGFEYFKEKDEDIRGEKTATIKMKPSSFIIAAIVDPLHFSFTPDGKRIVEIRGRTQVKRQDGKSFKELDARIVYDK